VERNVAVAKRGLQNVDHGIVVSGKRRGTMQAAARSKPRHAV